MSQYTPRPHTLPSLDQLRTALRSIGAKIASEGTPAKLGPFVIGLTGYALTLRFSLITSIDCILAQYWKRR